MAKEKEPSFYSGGRTSGDSGSPALALTTSFQDVVAGVADGSDLVSLVAVNSHTSVAKTLTIADKDDAIISVITIPANAGISGGVPAIDVLQNGYLKRGKEGPFGRIFHLPNATTKLRAKVDSASGGTITLHWEINDYTDQA